MSAHLTVSFNFSYLFNNTIWRVVPSSRTLYMFHYACITIVAVLFVAVAGILLLPTILEIPNQRYIVCMM